MDHTVFYSWQSDLPGNLNRSLIERAAKEAVKRVAADPDLTVEPRIDRDTAGVPGSPDIAQTIFDKVDGAAVFLCDVSIINSPVEDGERPVPNPNVAIELGYAVKALGWNRIILVFNSSTGRVEDLPFDIRHRRPVIYHADDSSNKSEAQRNLTESLAAAIKACLVMLPESDAADSFAEVAISAIEDQKPTRELAIERFWKSLIERMDALAPNFSGRSGHAQRQMADGDRLFRSHEVVESVTAAVPLLAAFAQIADTAARATDPEAITALYRGFEAIAERYFPTQGSGHFNDDDTDFYVFIGHELMLCLVSPVLRARKWALLKPIMDRKLFFRTSPSEAGDYVPFGFLAQGSDIFKVLGDSTRRISARADTVSSLHETEPLASIVSVQDAMEADLFLFYAGGGPSSPDWRSNWWPYGLLYLKSRPAFLTHARQPGVAEQIAQAMGLGSVDALKSRIAERAQEVPRMFNGRIRASRMYDLTLESGDN